MLTIMRPGRVLCPARWLHAAALLLAAPRGSADIVAEVLKYAKYCPGNPCEPPESHVVCTFYHENATRRCDEYPYKHEYTTELFGKVLSVINGLRRAVADGNATGKDGVPLPRGYGIRRLKWSYSLAGMARLVTETCPPTEYCVRTARYPLARRVDLKPVETSGVMDVSFAVQGLRSVLQDTYLEAQPEYIYSCPEHVCEPQELDYAHAYYYLVHGGATNVGCWTAHGVARDDPSLMRSYPVCYISKYPQPGGAVYNTSGGPGCGCPEYHDEIDGCLCDPWPTTTVPPSVPTRFPKIQMSVATAYPTRSTSALGYVAGYPRHRLQGDASHVN